MPAEFETPQRLQLLGQLLDGAGRYEEAFTAFCQMNAVALDNPSRPRERAARYMPEGTARAMLREYHALLQRERRAAA